MRTYDVGDQSRLSAEFYLEDPDPSDPAAVTLKITDPAGVTRTYAYGTSEIVRTRLGKYRYDLVLTLPGIWTYRWEGTATPTAAEEGQLIVSPSLI